MAPRVLRGKRAAIRAWSGPERSDPCIALQPAPARYRLEPSPAGMQPHRASSVPVSPAVVYGTRTNGTKPKSSGPMAAAAAAADDVYISAPEAGMTSAAAVVLPTVAPGTWA